MPCASMYRARKNHGASSRPTMRTSPPAPTLLADSFVEFRVSGHLSPQRRGFVELESHDRPLKTLGQRRTI